MFSLATTDDFTNLQYDASSIYLVGLCWPIPSWFIRSIYTVANLQNLPARATGSGESSRRALVLWRVDFLLQALGGDFIRARGLNLQLVSIETKRTTRCTYLLQDLESFLFSNRNGVPPRAGVQHTFLDRRSGRTSVHKDHDIRPGIVVEGIARRSRGDMCGDGVWLNTRLGIGQRDLLRGDINRLEEVSISISQIPPQSTPPPPRVVPVRRTYQLHQTTIL